MLIDALESGLIDVLDGKCIKKEKHFKQENFERKNFEKIREFENKWLGNIEETRKHFEEAGMDIVTAGHALSGAERCFSTYFGGYGPIEIVANTLRMFSQGVKVCVEVSTMALDAGKIPYQEKIVAIAGSGRGADTVVLLTPSYTRSILDTKVHKIIEMPE